ncbi:MULTISPECIES: GntR family transcriptional regulator [unclassified Devosia]|uniref:GntR family transcriptional regulator n=1 Tax=unclassified Devosia TaxID=196773 RepID=UPI0007141724|nr:MULTISPECIES: GntR family transcriptional regulator [unclassified Devosia]KQN77519.1 GntR family transcriptional regulator [Devosia sp. Leaf64]KQT49700.1 GntR family transcriptional regulator [Devosia sp. Leaf420]
MPPRKAPRAKPVEIDIDDAEDVNDRICATLSTAIADGALKPGSKIIEEAIAEHFGVSRTVVRGALGVLQRERLLERKRNRGTFVAEPSIEEAHQLFEARRALERTILSLVAQRITAADFEKLDAITAEELRVHQHGHQVAKATTIGEFHVELAAIAGNKVLSEMLAKLVARLSLVMALYEDERQDDCGADHHRQIVDALRASDLRKAQALMDTHLGDIEGRVRLTPGQSERHSFMSMLETFSD